MAIVNVPNQNCRCQIKQLRQILERAALFHSPSPDSFFLLLNTKGGKTNNRGSKKNPAFALTLKTIKQQ
jgi:hypothetical protein